MNFGITPNGFVNKTFEDIDLEVKEDQRELIPLIDQTPESLNGQYVGVINDRFADIWLRIQELYSQTKLSDAVDTSLDDICEYNNVTRQKAESSKGYVGIYGNTLSDGFVIPFGVQFKDKTTNEIYETKSQQTYSENNVRFVYCKIDAADSTLYVLGVNAGFYSYNHTTGMDSQTIAQQIVTAINNDIAAVVTAENLQDGYFIVRAKTNNFNAAFLNIKYYYPVFVESLNKKNMKSIKFNIDSLVNSLPDVEAVINLEDTEVGRNKETDTELRNRYLNSYQIAGACTVAAIKARVENIAGVSAVKVLTNRTNVIDGDGLPPNSVEVVLSGGDNNEIGTKLLNNIVGAGILTNGNVSVNVLDPNGDTKEVKFTRPVNKFVHINIVLTKTGDYPAGGDDIIKDNLFNDGLLYGVGDDVITQKLYCPVYKVQGILNAVITTGLTDNIGDTPVFDSNNKAITNKQIAIFDKAIITIL